MITEDYVSFETAKLLKEKGFDEVCENAYNEGGVFVSTLLIGHDCDKSFIVNNQTIFPYKAPTHQMAMAWLREKHNIHISVTIGSDVDNPNYIFYWAGIAKFTKSSLDYIDPFGEQEFSTNEEAVETALKYSLENLI